jgi:hypothetical protein
MARTGSGVYCRGGVTGAHVQTGIDIDALGGTPDVLVVMLGYYDDASDGSEITAVEYGDGTNWQTLTLIGTGHEGGFGTDQQARAYAVLNPNVSYDRIRITASEALTEGGIVGWHAESNATTTGIQSQAAFSGGPGETSSDTFTGGATGDRIVALTNGATTWGEGLVERASSAVACNSWGGGYLADKAWEDGTTAGAWSAQGDFLQVLAVHIPASASGVVLPSFDGPNIGNQSDVENQAIAPLDVSGLFTAGTGTSPTYSASGLPVGLSIDPATGIISGTPTTVGTNASCQVTLTTSEGSANSNLFSWEITTAITVQVLDIGATKPSGSFSVTDGSQATIGNQVEVPLSTDQGDAITWYGPPYDGTFVIDNSTGQKTFQARSREDSGSPWTPYATFTIN